MFEFLILSTPIVWIPLLIVFLLIEAVLVERNNPKGATFVLLGTLVSLQYFSDLKPFSLLWDRPLTVIAIILAYLVLGMVYAVIKWLSYVHQKNDSIEETFNKLAKGDGALANPATAATRRAELIEKATHTVLGYQSAGLPIQVSDNKARITTWMAYWPVSAAYTLLDDPLRRIWEAAYKRLGGSLQKISDRATAKLNSRIGA